MVMLPHRETHAPVISQCHDIATTARRRAGRKVRREQHSSKYSGIASFHVTFHGSTLLRVSIKQPTELVHGQPGMFSTNIKTNYKNKTQ